MGSLCYYRLENNEVTILVTLCNALKRKILVLYLLILLVAGFRKKTKPPTLFSLCLGVVGKHLDDIIEDLGEIAINFPADTKVAPRTILNFYIYIEVGIYVLDRYEYEHIDIGKYI